MQFDQYMKQTLLIILLFTQYCNVWPQQPVIRNFTSTSYHSGTQNWCISQSNDGRMFFANNNGLLEYDGDLWFSKSILNNNNARSVMYDKRHDIIYAGCTGEFGFFNINAKTSQVNYHSLSSVLPKGEKAFSEIWNIYKWNGSIVFQGNEDFFIHQPEGKTKDIKTKFRIKTSAVIRNRLLFATNEGIYEIKNGREMPVHGTEIMRGLTVRTIIPMGKYILFATASDGVFIYDGHTTTPYIMDITPQLKEYQIFCAAINSDYIAFGTVRNGLIIKNMKTGQTSYSNNTTGLQNNTVLSLKFDKWNNIWLGLDNGISYVLLEMPYCDLLGANNTIGTGYASMIYDNKLYLGTNQGLFYIPQHTTAAPAPSKPIPVITGQVWQLQNIDGILLCGCDAGAFAIKGGTCTKINGPDGSWNFHPLINHPGYILASDYIGFYILQKSGNTFIFRNRLKGFKETSGSFQIDTDGSVWIKHWMKGIYHITLTNDLTAVKTVHLYCKGKGLRASQCNELCMIDSRIYISSVDGLYHYDKSTRRLVYDKAASHIFNTYGASLKIYETPHHDLWAMKNDYIAIAHKRPGGYNVDSISYRSILNRLQNGMGDINCIDPEHTLFNYDNGFYMVDNHFSKKINDNKLIIRRIIGTNNADSTLYTAMLANHKNEIKIPHDQNSIRIEFVQPEYLRENSVEYTCYMEGMDKRWSERQSLTTKEYTRLSKGTYIFHVRSYNHISGKNQETQIKIIIMPAWYETTSAYLIYTILLILAIRYLVIFMNKRAKKEMHKIKEEQDVKLQIEKAKNTCELAEIKNEQLGVELKHKSCELADSTVNLIRKNDMLQSMDEDMIELSEFVRNEAARSIITRKIQSIRKSIQTNLNEDDNWEKFEENFNLVYDGYMRKLISRYPDLSKSDRKLCAYLRMGLSSKEMASLLNTSVRSIETARYRLRKKLNLCNGENLTYFIQELK